MMRKLMRILTVLLIATGLVGAAALPASAQNLLFQVESATADVFVQADGSTTIEYTYVFANEPSADAIDAVDIGLPTSGYKLSNVTADVNGSPVSDIEPSPYVNPGIALNLHSLAIAPGARGTVHVRVSGIQNLLYKTNKVADASEDYASFQFSPNSFGAEFVRGSTDLTVTLHLPPGLTEQEPRWFKPEKWGAAEEPTSGIDGDGNVFYQWQDPAASMAKQYIFGAAFPARLVPDSALATEPVINSSSDLGENICVLVFCPGFVIFLAIIIFSSVKSNKARRLQYLPPKIAIEGLGVKRGLTAVEAAVLLEQPLDKILTMILFSLGKKGAVRVITKEPLKIEALPNPPADLRAYEISFIKAMTADNKSETRTGLQDMMVHLVKTVTEKMRGFSRKETVAYYQEIANRAWGQVTAAGTPEVQMKAFDEAVEWTMLDRDYEKRSREVYGPRPVFLPGWWGNFDPTWNRPLTTTSAGPVSTGGAAVRPTQVGTAPGASSLPSLPGADVAASLAGGIQNFATNVVGDMTSFTAGVAKATNPTPKPSATSSRGGYSGGSGGRSCACACACACAGCACACAGGGR